jgi:hypothetical protein
MSKKQAEASNHQCLSSDANDSTIPTRLILTISIFSLMKELAPTGNPVRLPLSAVLNTFRHLPHPVYCHTIRSLRRLSFFAA